VTRFQILATYASKQNKWQSFTTAKMIE